MASTVGAGPGTTPQKPAESGTEEPRGYGWVIFAGVMIAIAGVMNVIYGIAAIDDSKFYAHDVKYVITGLNTWGWFLLCLGVAQLAAAVGIMAQTSGVRWFGVACAGGNIIINLLILPAAPFLAISLLAIDVLVIYGLVAYGKRPASA